MVEILKQIVQERLDAWHIAPNELLGQHFLVDLVALDIIAAAINRDSLVIEVGAGTGQLTERLAQKARQVLAVEIDRRFEPILQNITKKYRNISVIWRDFLSIDLEEIIQSNHTKEVQIVSNLPFFIIEPFLYKIISLPITNVVLVVGKKSAYALRAPIKDGRVLSKLTVLTAAFFTIECCATVKKEQSFPAPRTSSEILLLTPRYNTAHRDDRALFLLRRLLITAHTGTLVKNALREGLIQFSQAHREKGDSVYWGNSLTKNQARKIVREMGIPDATLSQSFEQLNNSALTALVRILYSYQ